MFQRSRSPARDDGRGDCHEEEGAKIRETISGLGRGEDKGDNEKDGGERKGVGAIEGERKGDGGDDREPGKTEKEEGL